jgi:hypothetical protein
LPRIHRLRKEDIAPASATGDPKRHAVFLIHLVAERLFDHPARYLLGLARAGKPSLVQRPSRRIQHVAGEQDHSGRGLGLLRRSLMHLVKRSFDIPS